MNRRNRITMAIASTLLLLTGCMTVSEVIQIPPEKRLSTASFRLPVSPSDENEAVVYVVNRRVAEPHKMDAGLIMTTAIVIEGVAVPLETVPGQYAVAKINPGRRAIHGERICRPSDHFVGKREETPAEGTVMPVRKNGWATYASPYGRGLSKDDAVFDFRGGKTYVFAIFPNCVYNFPARQFTLHPRIHEIDEEGGKYLVMNSTLATDRQ